MDLTGATKPQGFCEDNCQRRKPGCQDKCGKYISRAAIQMYYNELRQKKAKVKSDTHELNAHTYRRRD